MTNQNSSPSPSPSKQELRVQKKREKQSVNKEKVVSTAETLRKEYRGDPTQWSPQKGIPKFFIERSEELRLSVDDQLALETRYEEWVTDEKRKLSDSSDKSADEYLKERAKLIRGRIEAIKISRRVSSAIRRDNPQPLLDITNMTPEEQEGARKEAIAQEKGFTKSLEQADNLLNETETRTFQEHAFLHKMKKPLKAQLRESEFQCNQIGAAYIELLASNTRLPMPERATINLEGMYARPSGTASNFARDVRHHFNATHPDHDKADRMKLLWCAAAGDYLPSTDVKTAHIFPWGLGLRTAGWIFSNDPELGEHHMWNKRNGIPLCTYVEAQFDKGAVVIVPCPEDQSKLQFVVLERSLVDNDIWFTTPNGKLFWRDMDKRQLKFPEGCDNLPGRKYLYFHCIHSMMRRQYFGVIGYEHDRTRVPLDTVWATPEKYAKASILMVMARHYIYGKRALEDWKTSLSAHGFGGEGSEEDEDFESAMVSDLEMSKINMSGRIR